MPDLSVPVAVQQSNSKLAKQPRLLGFKAAAKQKKCFEGLAAAVELLVSGCRAPLFLVTLAQ